MAQMQVEFDLAATGLVERARVMPRVLAKTSLGHCLEQVASATSFGPQGQAVSFAIPLTASRTANSESYDVATPTAKKAPSAGPPRAASIAPKGNLERMPIEDDRDIVAPRTREGESLPSTPSRTDVLRSMKGVTSAVRACANGLQGVAMVRVGVAGATGTVMAVDLSGQFAGTTAGTCMVEEIKKAKFDEFAQSTFSFSYPFTL